jgi:hypothetical protein
MLDVKLEVANANGAASSAPDRLPLHPEPEPPAAALRVSELPPQRSPWAHA